MSISVSRERGDGVRMVESKLIGREHVIGHVIILRHLEVLAAYWT